MKTYSESRLELRDLQILKKMLEISSQFLSSEQTCEPKSLDVVLNIVGVETYAPNTCGCDQHRTNFVFGIVSFDCRVLFPSHFLKKRNGFFFLLPACRISSCLEKVFFVLHLSPSHIKQYFYSVHRCISYEFNTHSKKYSISTRNHVFSSMYL